MNELVQILKNTRQHLMTGVSHMIPFVVSGGILLAVSVMLYGKGAVPDAATDPNLKKLFDIGVAGLTLMVPFLAAYIGYSISDRAALAPCAIGAWVGWMGLPSVLLWACAVGLSLVFGILVVRRSVSGSKSRDSLA